MKVFGAAAMVGVLAVSCTGGRTIPTAANCEPSDGGVLRGELDGQEWTIAMEERADLTLVGIDIAGEDMGAVQASESVWYYAESDRVVVLAGSRQSDTTQAVGVMDDGSEVAFCPFGDEDLLLAGGAVLSNNRPKDLEMRRGGAVVAIGHIAEARELAKSPTFAFSVTPPGSATVVNTGIIRSPGAELTFDETDSSTTAP